MSNETENNFLKCSSHELTQIIQDTSHSGREYAQRIIVDRFWVDILRKCEIICKNRGHSVSVAEEIAENVFNSYFKKGKFQTKSDLKNFDAAFKIYLYSIANNELINYYRAKIKKEEGKEYFGNEEIVTDLPPVDFRKMNQKEIALYKIIQELPQNLRTVFLTYKTYEKSGVNLPKSLQLKLRTHIGGVSQSTVRTYKKEAKDRINQGLAGYKLAINED